MQLSELGDSAADGDAQEGRSLGCWKFYCPAPSARKLNQKGQTSMVPLLGAPVTNIPSEGPSSTWTCPVHKRTQHEESSIIHVYLRSRSWFHTDLLFWRNFLVAQTVKNLPAMQKNQVQSLGWEDPLEKEMAPHSSILAWKIPWMEETGRLQSMGSQRHDWSDLAFIFLILSQKLCLEILNPTCLYYGTLPSKFRLMTSGLPWW